MWNKTVLAFEDTILADSEAEARYVHSDSAEMLKAPPLRGTCIPPRTPPPLKPSRTPAGVIIHSLRDVEA